MNSKLPIELTPLQKTLLITLGGRADESAMPNSLLNDHFAQGARQQIDFDFSRLRLSHDGLVALAVRAHTIDQAITAFIAEHASPTVLHLGCGLDSRVFRVDPSAAIAWWEIDFPEVIELRRQLFPERAGCHFRETSVLEPNWLVGMPDDCPVIVAAEGIFAYFSYDQVCRVVRDVVERFPGGEIVFDAYNHWGVAYLNCLPSIRRGGAKLRFALDDPRQLERDIVGLKLVEVRTGAPPEQIKRASLPMRVGFRLAQHVGPLRHMGQLVRYRFGSCR